MLEQINLKQKLSKAKYKKLMPPLKKNLYNLQQAISQTDFPVIIVVEGWNGAGKGRAISTLTRHLDPRRFKLHPIRPPRTYEQKRPWLWRFWQRLPNDGEFGIFYTSWYRRVLTDRIEETLPTTEWQQAYHTIVNFERTLADDNTIIIKFWLHLSQKEQKNRFENREADILNAWRLTMEEWVHHLKYPAYFAAVEEMLEKTSTEWGPWTIIEAHNRYHAHVKIFKTIIETLEQKLNSAE